MSRKHQERTLTLPGPQAGQAVSAPAANSYRSFDGAAEGTLILDFDTGRIIEVAPSLTELLDLPRGEMVGRTVGELRPFKDIVSNQAVLKRLLGNGHTRYQVLPLETKDGRQLAVELVSEVYQAGDRKLIQCSLRDVADRQRVAAPTGESNERLQLAIRAGNIGIFDHDHNTDAIFWSPEMRQIFDWDPEEPVTMPKWLQQVHAEDRARIEEAVQRAHDPAGNGFFEVEYRIIDRNGGIRWLNTRARTHFEGEGGARRKARTFGAVADITERKQAEEALRQEQALMTILMDNIPDGVYFKDLTSRFIRSNRAQARRFGLDDPARLVGKSDADFFSTEHANQALADEQKIIHTGRPLLNVEEKETWPDGTIGWVLTTKLPLRDATGRIIGTCGISRDITERRRAETEAEESRQMLRTVLDTIPVRVFWKDRDGRYLGCNQSFASDSGLKSPQSLLGKDDYAMGWKEQADSYRADDKAVMASGIPKLQYEEPQTAPDGSQRWLRTNKIPLRDLTGKIIGVLGTYEDITERKQSEDKLKLSRALIENSADAIHVVDPATARFLEVNEQACRSLGYAREEHLALTVFDVTVGVDRARFDASVEQARKLGHLAVETQHRRKDGSTFPVEVNLTPVALDREYLVVIVRDITERKRTEEALRNSERFLRLVMDLVPHFIFVKDNQSRHLLVNRACAAVTNLTAEQMVGLSDRDLAPGSAQAEVFMKDDQEVIATGRPKFTEEQLVDANGQTHILQTTKIPFPLSALTFPIAGGGTPAILGVSVDITERKRAEAALRESQALYQSFFDQLPNAAFRKDGEGRFVMVNPRFCQIKGLKPEDFLGRKALEVPDSTEAIQGRRQLQSKYAAVGEDIHAQIMRTGKVVETEEEHIGADGRKLFLHVVRMPVFDADGTVVGTQSIQFDVSERKRAEAALAESRNFLDEIINAVPNPIFVKDRQHRGVLVNDAFCHLMGLRREDLIHKSDHDHGCLTRAQADEFRSRDELVFTTGKEDLNEETITAADGTLRIIITKKALYTDEQGEKFIVGIISDITERKQAELALQASEQKYRELVEHANSIIVRWKRDGAITFLNEFGQQFFGYSAAEIVGRHIVGTIVPETENTGRDLRPLMDQIREDPKSFAQNINQNQRRNGELVWIAWTNKAVLDEQGQVTEILSVGTDITERKRAEERVADALNFNLTILRTSPAGILVYRSSGQCISVNEAAAAIVGGPMEQLLQQNFRQLGSWKHSGLVAAADAALASGTEQKVEARLTSSFGKQSWLNCRFVPFQYGGEPHLFLILTDVSDYKRAEEALRNNEAFLNTVVENIPHMIFVKDAKELRFLKFNRAGEELLGYSRAELAGKNDYDFFPKDLADLFTEKDRQVLQGKEVVDIPEEAVQTRDKRERILHTKKIPVFDNTGQALYLLGISEDITARQQADQYQARLAKAVEQAAESILITDTRSTILYVNPAFERASGYSRAEVLGQNARLLKSGKHDADFYRRMWGALGRGETWTGHFINRRKDGAFYEEEATISPVRNAAGAIVNYVAVKHDVTRERQLEAQFHQAQKMEAIGQLAGGVAHDFNNILGVIIGYSDLITSDLDPDSPLQKYVGEIREASQRAVGLTRQLLVFSRKQKVQPVVLDLNDAVKDLDKMLRRLIGENIEMIVTPGNDLGHILADPGHLGQVLMNLVVNARDAMPNGGRLTIATGNATLDEDHTRAHAGAHPGDYVRLSVTDSGIGMTPEVKARLFEALFTTKPAGKGTGLGLATCQTIVQQSGGFIAVESEVGQGATFNIYFPRVDQPLAAAASSVQSEPLPRGKETVLLVEDEPSVRHLAASVLEAQGYTVLRANNGLEALHLAQNHKGLPIRLVVTDVIMPRMGGKAMADWLKATYPDLKVLFTSGYTDDAIAHQGVLDPGVAFLAKPYSPEALARKVRAMLDRQTDTAFRQKPAEPKNPPSAGSKGKP